MNVSRILFVLAIAFTSLFVHDLFYFPLPTQTKRIRLYTNQERIDLKRSLIHAFSKAQNEIIISVYSFTDKEIIKKLNQKAEEGIKIHIGVDKKQHRSLSKKLSNKIELRTRPQKGLMHEKIFLVDDTVFVGSSNLTTTSLRMHDNLMVGLFNPPLKEALKSYLVEELPFTRFNQEGLEFYSLPSEAALKRIMALIKNSKKSLDIALFTFTHPLIAEAVIQAHLRGVKVRVVFDYLSHKGASRFVVESLREANIPIFHNRGVQLMHHKMALIDQDVLVIGSTNWTKSAFTRNQDDLLILSSLNKRKTKKIRKIFRHLFWESKQIL